MSPNPTIPNLKGKVALVTGGSAGIGYETALQLATSGCTVYITARSATRASSAVSSILSAKPGAEVYSLLFDLTSLSTVVTAAKEFISRSRRLDLLITCAGIMATPFSLTDDGFEAQWQTNYLSHWLLTYHLLPLMRETANSVDVAPGSVRIVNVSSGGHSAFAPKTGIDFEDLSQEKSGGEWSRYGQSKLGNVLHARQLSKLYGPNSSTVLEGGGGKMGAKGYIWTSSIHPGNVATDLNRNSALGKLPGASFVEKAFKCLGVYIPVEKSGRGLVLAAAGVKEDQMPYYASGSYLELGRLSKSSRMGDDEALAARLWEWTEKELGRRGLLV